MKPVYQQIINADRGDCMSACIASLLELPIEEVPKWQAEEYDRTPGKSAAYRDRDSHYAMLDWLHGRGWALTIMLWNRLGDWRGTKDLNLIVSVPSQKFPGVSHAVIIGFRSFENVNRAYEWYVAHDPNPGNAPYDTKAVQPSMVYLLLPLRFGCPGPASGEGK